MKDWATLMARDNTLAREKRGWLWLFGGHMPGFCCCWAGGVGWGVLPTTSPLRGNVSPLCCCPGVAGLAGEEEGDGEEEERLELLRTRWRVSGVKGAPAGFEEFWVTG